MMIRRIHGTFQRFSGAVRRKWEKRLPVVEFHSRHVPPRVHWKIDRLSVSRSQAGRFCDRLYVLVIERQGACFFIPDDDRKVNSCRYEWHYALNGDPYALRVGLRFSVGNASVSSIEAYVTTKELIAAYSGEPLIEPATIADVQTDVAAMVNDAELGLTEQLRADWRVVLHAKVPHGHGFAAEAEAGPFCFCITKVLPEGISERVSPVVVRCTAGSREYAKRQGSQQLMLALALLTLSEQRKFELAAIDWGRHTDHQSVYAPEDLPPPDRLLPQKGWEDAGGSIDPKVSGRLKQLWTAYEGLKPADQIVFRDALLAFYIGTNPHSSHATLSTVTYISALSALSAPLKEKCTGNLSCSIHGSLSWRHDNISEVRAIIELVVQTCQIVDPAKMGLIDSLVKAVHREQRSSFVHGAIWRHDEFNQGSQAPPVMPTDELVVSKMFEYQEQLTAIAYLTRRTLLQWIHRKSGLEFDFALFDIDPDRVSYRSTAGYVVAVSPKFEARLSGG